MSDIINKSLIFLIPLFCFIVFSSLSFYWVQAPYDAWRIYEILLLIFVNIIGIYLIHKKRAHFLNIKINKLVILAIPILVILVFFSALNAKYPSRAFADASLYFLLISSCFIYAYIFHQYTIFAKKIVSMVAILPMLTLIFLPIAIWDRLNGGIGTWTQSFTNIRMLDDALLPCLFLLWLRVGFLKKNENLTYIKKWILTIVLYSVSSIYLLSFLFHGARACILSIFIGILIISIYNRKNSLQFLKLPIVSSFLAITLYISYHQILPNLIGSSLTRSDSSGRIDLWLKSFKIWHEHTILGVGGNHFLWQQPYTVIAHPHSIWLKFLSEWGLSAFIFLGLLCFLLIQIKPKIDNIPPILISGIIAISINSMLSGSFIYPVSQIINLCFIAYTFSFCININATNTINNELKYIWIILIIIFSTIILYIHWQDLFCMNCISNDVVGAPAFWDAGRAFHLDPY